jgi:hypothetical protein
MIKNRNQLGALLVPIFEVLSTLLIYFPSAECFRQDLRDTLINSGQRSARMLIDGTLKI